MSVKNSEFKKCLDNLSLKFNYYSYNIYMISYSILNHFNLNLKIYGTNKYVYMFLESFFQ